MHLSRTGARSALILVVAATACHRTPRPVTGSRVLTPPPTLTALGLHNVVPAPLSVTPAAGAHFALTKTTTIVVPAADSAATRVGNALATLLRPSTFFPHPVGPDTGAAPLGAILLRLDPGQALGPEGYELTITADSVRIAASSAAGLFHGVQTLRQLLPAGIEAEQGEMKMATAWTVPPGRIVDRPRFQWRGAMLDVARHFFSVDEVKQFIDILALYKLNTLHLHLADDQGWRIQIDSWPRLTAFGSLTEVGGNPGGFFTKADYAEIVRYAGDRFITIVPEIDMPGHTNAAIASYPELGCSRPTPGIYGGTQPLGLYTGIGVGFSTFCTDSAVTYRFVDDVVRELAAMTPGPYIHLGGDEVHSLPREKYVQFVERIQDIVAAHGKTMVGWEEIGRAKLRPTTIAQHWQGDTALLAVRQGVKLILSPGSKVYLDMKYTSSTELGLRWAGFIDLRTTYDWEPTSLLGGLSENGIIGIESPLWAETIQNITAAEYLAMPRIPAVAELSWSAANVRDWERFRTRLATHAPRWRLLGIAYYASPQIPW